MRRTGSIDGRASWDSREWGVRNAAARERRELWEPGPSMSILANEKAARRGMFRNRGKWSYLSDRPHFTSFWMSASLTVELGGIGTWPQTPVPPCFTLATSFASAVLSPLYLAATSLKAGPTTFLSTAWQAVQALFVARASSSAANARAAPRAIAAAARLRVLRVGLGSC